jgi:hypothetical protein
MRKSAGDGSGNSVGRGSSSGGGGLLARWW